MLKSVCIVRKSVRTKVHLCHAVPAAAPTPAADATPACPVGIDVGAAQRLTLSAGEDLARRTPDRRRLRRRQRRLARAQRSSRSRRRAEQSLGRGVEVWVCYEAGYEGFWLACRLKQELGIETVVLDPASLLVNRKAKQRKTDRINARKMASALLAYDRGDAAGLSRVRVRVPRPTPSLRVRACAIESDRPDGNLRNCVHEREHPLQVVVRDNNVDQALKALKKKLQREGLYREMKKRRAYEKPSERRAREKSEAVRRWRKLQRKRAAREA